MRHAAGHARMTKTTPCENRKGNGKGKGNGRAGLTNEKAAANAAATAKTSQAKKRALPQAGSANPEMASRNTAA